MKGNFMADNSLDRSRKRNIQRKSHWRESLTAVMQDKSIIPEINVGRRLQELRTEQGFSIRALAELSGLNFNTLSLIENEKTSPNVNTMQQLATALQVPITAFFEPDALIKEIVFQKSGQRPHTSFPHGGLEDLGGGLSLGEATPLLMTASPLSESGTDMIVHTGQEFVYCLEGSISYFVGSDEYVLEQGDSLIFQAHIPHSWKNTNNSTASFILIICPEDKGDRSVDLHLNDTLGNKK